MSERTWGFKSPLAHFTESPGHEDVSFSTALLRRSGEGLKATKRTRIGHALNARSPFPASLVVYPSDFNMPRLSRPEVAEPLRQYPLTGVMGVTGRCGAPLRPASLGLAPPLTASQAAASLRTGHLMGPCDSSGASDGENIEMTAQTSKLEVRITVTWRWSGARRPFGARCDVQPWRPDAGEPKRFGSFVSDIGTRSLSEVKCR